MVITGYRLKTMNINEIMAQMEDVKRRLKKITNSEYNKLLSEEITFLVDQVSLNNIPRDNEITIFDGAVQNINERISRVETLNISSKYNFRVFAHILPYEDYIYLKVISPNTRLLKAFKTLEDYSLSEIECEDSQNAKTILWQNLHKMYKNTEPMVISLTQEPTPDKESLSFQSVKERAGKETRNQILMRLLTEITGGKEIPPIRLMPYFHEVLEQYMNDRSLDVERKQSETKLMQILIDLEKDSSIIYNLPQENIVEE